MERIGTDLVCGVTSDAADYGLCSSYGRVDVGLEGGRIVA